MQFDSLAYVLLLVATTVAFFQLGPRARVWLLIAASLIFYAAWSVPFTALIILSAFLDYFAALGVHVSRTRGRRLGFLMLSLVGNLGLLGYFKYANFFLDNLRALVGDGVVGDTLAIVLPPGISFYTFQTMSYTIDVYRGDLVPTRKFDRLFLFVTFFPQLVAGPIERAGHLMTQFEHAITQRFRVENLVVGARMIIYGVAKKVLLADTCARIVDPVYSDPGAFDGWSLLVATYAFTLQIYFDFSAYSEIARGSARIFGVDLMRNFDQPYLAGNPSEFWRRWHISLSTWIRDYVYLPLGGNRGTRARSLANLVITMFLSGLWHGAAWTFVLWGLYHGVLLLFDVLIRRTDLVRRQLAVIPTAWRGFLGWFVTFHLVVGGWVLFRAETDADAGIVFAGIGSAVLSVGALLPAQLGFLAVVAVFLGLTWLDRTRGVLRAIDADGPMSIVFYGALLVLATLGAPAEAPGFIYFQF